MKIFLIMKRFILLLFFGALLFLPVIKESLKKERFIGKERENLLISTMISAHNVNIAIKKEENKEKITYINYTVQPNDTLWSISRKFGLNLSTIISVNNLKTNILHPKMNLKIPNQKGITYKVKEGQTLWDIARKFNIPLNKIKEANEITTSIIRPGQRIFLPGVNLTQEIAFTQQISDKFLKPVFGYVSSSFGYRHHPILEKYLFHRGVDLKTPYGSTVKASLDGKIVFAGWKSGYGKCVIIKHNDVYKTVYGHLSKIFVNTGQFVEKGEGIGMAGNSGLTTGSHLHFEVLKNNRPINPLSLIR